MANVSKRFPRRRSSDGDFLALRDVTLDVEPGEFVSLIGASGCGKTTLLRMVAGLTPITGGSIEINNKPVHGVPPDIGFVFQEPALLPWRTVKDNLLFVLQRSSLSKRTKEELIESKLELTGLSKFRDYYPHALSGGMQQRVGLARALVGSPGVLLMDEPLSALDAFTRRRLQQDVAEIVESSETTTVLVTHEVDEALFFSDRVVVMSTSPGTIQEIIEVRVPRPRRHENMVHDLMVAELRAKILDLVLGFNTGRSNRNSQERSLE